MLIHNGRYGKFYGCSEYPDCHETRPFNTKSKSKKTNQSQIFQKKFGERCYKKGKSLCKRGFNLYKL